MPITQLQKTIHLLEREVEISRGTINCIDDFFEYANESDLDRIQVRKILKDHSERLVDLQHEV